jgi:hypothetical protein
MRRAVLGATIIAAFAIGCSSHGKEPDVKTFDSIDTGAWKAAMVNVGAPSADIRGMYDVTVKDCNDTIHNLALQFTLTNSHPDWLRIGMTYVCPTKVGNVDQALKSNQDTEDKFTRICDTPPAQRTHDEQQLLDAVGPDACAGK